MSSLFSENSLRISPVPPRINAPVPVFSKTLGRGSIKNGSLKEVKDFSTEDNLFLCLRSLAMKEPIRSFIFGTECGSLGVTTLPLTSLGVSLSYLSGTLRGCSIVRPLPGTEEYIKVFTVSLLRTIIQICHT